MPYGEQRYSQAGKVFALSILQPVLLTGTVGDMSLNLLISLQSKIPFMAHK